MDKYLSVVTGGAQGIGLAIVEALLKSGGKVYFLDVKDEQGKKTEGELQSKYGPSNVKFLKCNVANGEELEGAIRIAKKEMGGLNVLCNNAGIGRPFFDTSRWEAEVDINLKATIRGTMLGLELMSVDKGGSGGTIMNTASISGINNDTFCPVYCATKAGVIAYTRSIAPIAMPSKVRINCVCPDRTDTQLLNTTVADMASNFTHEQIHALLPSISIAEGDMQQDLSSKIQKPEDVAECVMKIIEDKTKTGEAWVVSKKLGTYCHIFQ